MAKRRRKRTRYTPEQRSTILTTAKKQGMTAAQVQERFGVTPVTYYSWRKKNRIGGRRTRVFAARSGNGEIAVQVRSRIQSRVREILPEIVRSEVSAYLDSMFGTSGGRRGRRART